MTWNGEERRGNPEDTGVRLALLEKCASDTERRHAENKESLVAVHVRITKLGKDFEQAFSKGLDAIMDKLNKQDVLYQARSERITKAESDIKWIKAWVASAWITISAGIGLLIHKKG